MVQKVVKLNVGGTTYSEWEYTTSLQTLRSFPDQCYQTIFSRLKGVRASEIESHPSVPQWVAVFAAKRRDFFPSVMPVLSDVRRAAAAFRTEKCIRGDPKRILAGFSLT